MTTWRPVETAPKDRHILLYLPGERPVDTNARPDEMKQCNIVVGIWRGQHDRGWWISDIVGYDYGYYDNIDWEATRLHPTYWAPLPQTP